MVKKSTIFLFEWVKFRNPPFKLFDYVFQRYIQKDRWSIEIMIPFIHIYYEINFPY